MVNNIGQPAVGINFWRNLDSNGVVGTTDFNILAAHFLHDCDTPLLP
jgi:hypothetical protein